MTIRLTAKGALSAATLLSALILIPRLFAGTLTPQEAEKLVRAYDERQIMQSFTAQYQEGGAGRSHASAQRMVDDLQRVRGSRFRSVKVRRALILPPLARRTAFLIEVWREGAAAPQYFRTGRAGVYETTPFWWRFPL